MHERKSIDPRGVVECETCEEIGRPKSGVVTVLAGRRVTKGFDLPDGWAVAADGALQCGDCAGPFLRGVKGKS